MVKYKLELKPIRTYGVDALPDDRLQFFGIMINALSQMVMMIEGVSSATVMEDYSLIIEGDDSIEESMVKFHDQAILTKLE